MAVNANNWFTVTIDSSKVPSTQTDFPVYIDLSDLGSSHGFWSNVKSDGGDIRVTEDADNGSEVPFELVSLDTSNNTGELHFKAPTVSGSSNTTFRVWYNSSDTAYSTTDTYGRNNVWTDWGGGSVQGAVYHMNQDPSSGSLINSAGNASLNADGSFTSGQLVDGKIGKAISFDGSAYFKNGDSSIIDTGRPNIQLMIWVKQDANDNESLVETNDSTADQGYRLTYDFDSGWKPHMNVYNSNGYVTSDQDANAGSWQFIEFNHTFSGLSYWNQEYHGWNIDGLIRQDYHSHAGSNSSTVVFNGNQLRLGGSSKILQGDISEFRIRMGEGMSLLSDDYIKAQYNNQSDTSTFYTLSSEQSTVTIVDASFGISQTNTVTQTNKATSGGSVSVAQQSTIQDASNASIDSALSLSQLSTILDSSDVSATADINIDSIQSMDSNGVASTQASLSQALINAINSSGNRLIVASFSMSSQSTISQSNQVAAGGSVNLSIQSMFAVLSNAFASADISMSSVQSFTMIGNTAEVTLTDGRTLTIKFENRTVTPEKEDRTIVVPEPKSRELKVEKENRTVVVKEENRTNTV